MTHALATIVLVASLLAVLAYWYSAQQRGLQQAEATFRAGSDQVVDLLRQRLVNYELLVRGGASLQASLPQPSRAQWQGYVGGLNIDERFPAVQALGFALDAQPQELGALEHLLPGIESGAMRPASTGADTHGFVLYVAPETAANQQATGADLALEPRRRQAMRLAADTGELRMSAAVPAIDAVGMAADQVALFAPVYSPMEARDDAARRQALRGWVFAQIRIDRFVDIALRRPPDAGSFRIVDVSDGDGNVLYSHEDAEGRDPTDAEAASPPAFTYRVPLQTLGRDWRIEFESPPFDRVQREIPGLRTTLLIGLLASFLVFGIAWNMARTQMRAELLAARMSDSYRRSEQRFRSAMQYSAIGKALLDRSGRIVEANPAMAQLLGTTPEALVGTEFVQHFVDDESIRTVERETTSQGAFRTTRRLRRSDGDVRHASLTFATVPGEVGEEFARLVQVEDVTERMRAEAQVQALNRTLEARVALRTRELSHANQELEAFAYSVSHDLRAPLRSIDGFSRLLAERYHDVIDASGQDYLSRIRSATARMGDLIDALLRMSRVSRGEMKYADVDLSRLASDVAGELRNAEPGRTVALDIAPQLRAAGDPSLLRNLLENLIGNAWKFTRLRQDARIEIGREGDEFYVRDNGAGFSPEYAGKLFRPFQRLHTEQEFAGHGIGLASVKRIVERHGGSIRAEGVAGQGAIFRFRLPPRAPEPG